MAADAAVSAGVVVAALIVAWTGMSWIDPAMSLLIVAVIVIGTWGLFRGLARHVAAGRAAAYRYGGGEGLPRGLPGVTAVHHVHIWPTSTTETALTAHL